MFYRSSDPTNNVRALKGEEISVRGYERMKVSIGSMRTLPFSLLFPLFFFEILGRKHFRLVFFLLFFCWKGLSTCIHHHRVQSQHSQNILSREERTRTLS